MIIVNIHEAKAKLSEYLEAVARGERVVICNRNRPVAELHGMPAARVEPRPIGGSAHRITVPPSFFEPLPDSELDAWSGGPVERADRVAEGRSAVYSTRRTRATRPTRTPRKP